MRPTRPLLLAASLAAIAVPGCAPIPDDELVEASEGELTVCAHGGTVEGVDVSSWQGHIDWSAVAHAGIRYAIVRIGDGTYHDPDFATNWSGAHRAGLIRGAYQYFEPRTDALVQANLVVTAVGRLGAGDLPVTLDVEKPSPGVSPSAYAAAIRRWVDRVYQGTGRHPIIYTGRYYWDPYVASSAFNTLPLWHAQYTSASCPNINDRWHTWTFWQYTSSGRVAGISGNVDRDRFNGTFTQLQALAGIQTCTASCSGNTLVSTSCHHTDCTATGGRCVTAGGPHCAFDACPATGTATVCVDDHTTGTCANGAVTRHACATHQLCTTAGMQTAHCASTVCVPDVHTAPHAHDVCLASGQIAHCDAHGVLGAGHACATGETCEAMGTTASCVLPMMSEPDAGMTGGTMGGGGATDGGIVGHDAGGHDAGAPQHDAGHAFVGDGGVAHGDAAAPMHPPPNLAGGCSVSASRSGAWTALAIAAAIAAVGRRRRSRA
jgi:GH25 family lysozyme M1 (1,4-beta-N-acetylmuramidase)